MMTWKLYQKGSHDQKRLMKQENSTHFTRYLMKGDLDVAKEAVENEFIAILTELAEVLKDRFSCFLEDTTFHVMATFLDTQAYVHTDVSDLYEAVNSSGISSVMFCKKMDAKKRS